MTDLDEAIANIDRQIKTLQDDREALMRAAAIIKRQTQLIASVSSSAPIGLSIGDATAKILREEGPQLHADVIAKRLAQMGKRTTKQSVVSALIRDKERFENLGRNVFRLRVSTAELMKDLMTKTA